MDDPVIFSTFWEVVYHPELGYYITSGIEVAPFCRLLDTGQRVRVHDVSIRRYEAERLAHRMNLGKLSVLHLMDVVLDSLP